MHANVFPLVKMTMQRLTLSIEITSGFWYWFKDDKSSCGHFQMLKDGADNVNGVKRESDFYPKIQQEKGAGTPPKRGPHFVD